MQLIIGTYTETLPHVHGTAEGIMTAPFDPATGTVGPVTLAARIRNPSLPHAVGRRGQRVRGQRDRVVRCRRGAGRGEWPPTRATPDPAG